MEDEAVDEDAAVAASRGAEAAAEAAPGEAAAAAGAVLRR